MTNRKKAATPRADGEPNADEREGDKPAKIHPESQDAKVASEKAREHGLDVVNGKLDLILAELREHSKKLDEIPEIKRSLEFSLEEISELKSETKKIRNDVSDEIETLCSEASRWALTNRAGIDNLQQKNLQDTVRVTGLPPSVDENQVREILKICKSDINDYEILKIKITKPNARLGNQNRSNPAKKASAVIQLASKATADAVLRKKKELKEARPGTCVNCELTSLRAKLLSVVRGLNNVQFAFPRDGTIICLTDRTDGKKWVSLETFLDLPKLGISKSEWDDLGLSELVLSDTTGTRH